jgi:hypothetical protein
VQALLQAQTIEDEAARPQQQLKNNNNCRAKNTSL